MFSAESVFPQMDLEPIVNYNCCVLPYTRCGVPCMLTPSTDPERRTDLERGVDTPTMQSEVVFRDLDEADLPSVKELHRALFPVQYSDSFYTRLFAEGYFCLVGEVEGEVIAVASARAVDQNGQEARDAYIMTLGVRVMQAHSRSTLAPGMRGVV
jgi:hypothetical protein